MDRGPGRLPNEGTRGAPNLFEATARPGTGSGTKVALGGGCAVLVALLLSGPVGLALLGTGDRPIVVVGEPLIMGSVEWMVTGAGRDARSFEKSDGKEPPEKGRLYVVIVDLSFTNNSSDDIELDQEALALVASDGQRIPPNTGAARILVENAENMTYGMVGPGETREGRVVFEVPPGTSGFLLEASDFGPLRPRSGYVDLNL